MSQFSTNEAVSLEKQVNLEQNVPKTPPENIDSVYELEKCCNWIKTNNFEKVCLQFPDYLLQDASDVAFNLQERLNQTVYVLGDTAYESCCIDYIAASHVNADAIIHFGPVCFSQTTGTVPYLNIFEKRHINYKQFLDCFNKQFKDSSENIVVLLDTPYVHIIDEIAKLFESFPKVTVKAVTETNLNLLDAIVLFVGENLNKIKNTLFMFKPKQLFYYTGGEKITNYLGESQILKRRYFLSEKIKDSNTVGIIVGTLAVKNYLSVIERVKKLVDLYGKKYYLISVGKPTVAKLANFPEIDVYVLITCSLNEIYESRDFYKPIVTPYDVELALNPDKTNLPDFSYDFNNYLPKVTDLNDLNLQNALSDVSLITGNIRFVPTKQSNTEPENGNNQSLMVKDSGVLALNTSHGGGFLNSRSWKGLEQNMGQTEVKCAEQGRSGIADNYENEPEKKN